MRPPKEAQPESPARTTTRRIAASDGRHQSATLLGGEALWVAREARSLLESPGLDAPELRARRQVFLTRKAALVAMMEAKP
jgi:hypothetical protein